MTAALWVLATVAVFWTVVRVVSAVAAVREKKRAAELKTKLQGMGGA